MGRRILPSDCPSCGQRLRAKRLECPRCATSVEGEFELPLLLRLQPDEQAFVVSFILCGGGVKELARACGVSYPTVRNRLDALMARVRALEAECKAVDEEAAPHEQ